MALPFVIWRIGVQEYTTLRNIRRPNRLMTLILFRYLTYRTSQLCKITQSPSRYEGNDSRPNLPWHDSQNKRCSITANLWISWSVNDFTANQLAHVHWSMWTEKNVYMALPFFIWRTGVQDYTTFEIPAYLNMLITFVHLRYLTYRGQGFLSQRYLQVNGGESSEHTQCAK